MPFIVDNFKIIIYAIVGKYNNVENHKNQNKKILNCPAFGLEEKAETTGTLQAPPGDQNGINSSVNNKIPKLFSRFFRKCVYVSGVVTMSTSTTVTLCRIKWHLFMLC